MVDLDELERLEREAAPAPWKTSLTEVASGDGEWEYRLIAERGRAAMPYSDFALIAAARNALPDLIAELRTLRARVSELEEENEQLRWARRASCVRKPIPGCDCPGCETARERSAQVDLVASYEAELEEDRQAERDRILGARVREVLEANGTNPEGFVSEWCRAQAEHETEEAER